MTRFKFTAISPITISGPLPINTVVTIPERARCKMTAHYRYTASRSRDDYGKTGNYCWSHTVSMLHDDRYRYDSWRKAQEAQS